MILTRKEAVLDYLRRRRNTWVNAPELQTPEVGGSEATRRLRELRAAGYTIHKRSNPDPRRSSYQYMLVEEDANQTKLGFF